ncbi:lytic transglycosylase F [Variovorax saccharolyticus]|uniref:transglycosylase SLT domain-containing protein n=1 Tax=Variovorax saccharolyticus TaxID=3053516 RepID=UPI002576B0DF|nr:MULTISPECIES: lytic transglycosylase F [unclassified Variovorax]MDM0022527.1 lytic transglycosylase F [Variovorax sp. J22R187]MDM0028291.1 lytic transglycosylase F [Variovorax sp. J31P216]
MKTAHVWLSFVLSCFLSGGPAFAEDAGPKKAAGGTLTIDLAQAKPWTGDLDGMIERRVIRVLTVNSKTFYFVDKGVNRGIVVDHFRLFEDELNKKLAAEGKLKNKNLKVRVVFIPVSRDQLLNGLVTGKGDIAAASLTITPERQKLVDFSSAGMSNVSEVVVTGPASPKVADLDDLAGKDVFVRRSSSYYESLLALNKKFEAERKAPVNLKEAPETLEDEDLLEMLNAGLVGIVIVDKYIADFWKQIFPKVTVHDNVAVRTGGEIAWAIRKGSPQLKAAVDDFANRNKVGTATGNQLLTRYLKNVKYLKNAASEEERKKFYALVEYFRKYGQQYDVDWVLMGAQGYQESQLNQNAKSQVGAIGVMQLMPATGKDMKVGDIRETEANIHAGIKYMRWMIDQYYGKEPMTPLDKALFAFASYNAGAGRISSMRKEAAKRGLDPNIWFQNVEYVVAEKIGQETITYVNNIYKYYVGYRLMQEGRAATKEAVEKVKSGSGK